MKKSLNPLALAALSTMIMAQAFADTFPKFGISVPRNWLGRGITGIVVEITNSESPTRAVLAYDTLTVEPKGSVDYRKYLASTTAEVGEPNVGFIFRGYPGDTTEVAPGNVLRIWLVDAQGNARRVPGSENPDGSFTIYGDSVPRAALADDIRSVATCRRTKHVSLAAQSDPARIETDLRCPGGLRSADRTDTQPFPTN